MSRDFEIKGPYDVMRIKNVDSVYYKMEEKCTAEVLDSSGCYVFYIQKDKNLIPWYVGKTLRGFKAELFTPHKQAHLSGLKGKHGSLKVLFVVPKPAAGAPPKRYISEVEKYLIKSCATINDKLLNTAHNTDPDWRIVGLTWWGRGNPSEPSKVLHTMLSGRKGYALGGG